MAHSACSRSLQVMDSRTQLEKDVLTLFKEKEELARKLAAATKLAQVNVGGHCACRSGYCDGPTLGKRRRLAAEGNIFSFRRVQAGAALGEQLPLPGVRTRDEGGPAGDAAQRQEQRPPEAALRPGPPGDLRVRSPTVHAISRDLGPRRRS